MAISPLPRPPDGDGDETDPQEFTAGFYDGLKAAKAELLNAVRPELARFDLIVDERGCVDRNPFDDAPPTTAPLAVPPRDNPDHHPAYERGWNRGREMAPQLLLEAIRHSESFACRDLFVTGEGNVTTQEVAEELVDHFRRRLREIGDGQADDDAFVATRVSAAALRDFLDRALHLDSRDPPGDHAMSEPALRELVIDAVRHRETPREDPEEGEGDAPAAALAEESPRPAGAGHASDPAAPAGVLRRMGRVLDRRLAVGLMVGALASSSVWLLLKPAEARRPPSTGPSYVPPSTWDAHPPAYRAFMLFVDQTFWELERPATQGLLDAKLARILTAPSQDPLKGFLARYVLDTDKTHYIPILIQGLSPAVSGPDARLDVATYLATMAAAQTPATLHGFTTADRVALQAAVAAEPDPQVAAKLTLLVQLLTGLGL